MGRLLTRLFIGLSVCGLVLCVALSVRPQMESVSAGAAAFGSGQTVRGEILYVSAGDDWIGFFREPFETVVFKFPTKPLFVAYSTHEANRVGVSIAQIIENLTRMGKKVSDCLMVVHNHFSPMSFTASDRVTCYELKRRGFTGVFAIYHSARGELELFKDSKEPNG